MDHHHDFHGEPGGRRASLIKGIQRLIGTVAGGGVGVLITIAFANEPWFMLVSIGVSVAVGMFLSRTRRPVDTSAPSRPTPSVDVTPGIGFPTLVTYMEATLARFAAATRFVAGRPGAVEHPSVPPPSVLDTPQRTPFLTPAFSLSNTDDIQFAIKCAVAVEICFLMLLGLDWPGLITSTISCVIIAKSSFGASIYQARQAKVAPSRPTEASDRAR